MSSPTSVADRTSTTAQTDTSTPLTVIQDRADPAWQALIARFWRTRLPVPVTTHVTAEIRFVAREARRKGARS